LDKRFALRVDIDTVRGLVDGVPPLLAICEELGTRATFFATVGTDTAARAFVLAPRLRRHMAISPLAKYGLREILGSIAGRRFLPHAEKIRNIEKRGHELQLHCYNHLDWVRNIERADPPRALSMIERGAEAFEKMLGRRPEGFASPSFKVTDAVLDAEERLGFRYASDYRLEGDRGPFKEGKRSVLQIPVNAPLIEDLVAEGLPDDHIISRIVDVVGSSALTVMYIHACYEPLAKPQLLRSTLQKALELAQCVTFTEIWQAWNRSE